MWQILRSRHLLKFPCGSDHLKGTIFQGEFEQSRPVKYNYRHVKSTLLIVTKSQTARISTG